jgi:hypothetical protein
MRTQVSKIDIALIQLRTAVQLYNKKNYISAITLAGASEEILGQIANIRSGTNALLDDKIWIDQIADYFKKPRPAFSRVAKSRNKIKNELKHNDTGQDIKVDFDFKFEAEEFILGAIRNHELVTGILPNDRTIKSFWNLISM